MQYRIVQPLMVLAFQDNHYAATTVPEGTQIDVVGPVPEDDRFVIVRFNSQLFHIFASDLEERAKPCAMRSMRNRTQSEISKGHLHDGTTSD